MNTEPCLLRWEQVWLAAQRPFVALRLVPQEGGSCVFAPAKFTVSLPSDGTNDHLMGDFLGGAILAEPFSQKDRRFIRSFIQNQPFFFCSFIQSQQFNFFRVSKLSSHFLRDCYTLGIE